MAKIHWTAEDKKTVLQAKRRNKYWHWDKLAELIDNRQTPTACQNLYQKHYPAEISRRSTMPYKRVRESSPPWSLAQRRRMAKLRAMDPPSTWREIAADISTGDHDYHPYASCQTYYEDLMTSREKARGVQDARSEQGITKPTMYTAGLMKAWTTQRWSPEEEEQLRDMCMDRMMPWLEIADKLKRTVGSCQAKWSRLENLHRVASTKESKGKVVKDKTKKAAGLNKKKRIELSSRTYSPGIGNSGT